LAISGAAATRRKVRFQHLDKTTTPFFFTGFPDNASNTVMWSLFARFGQVEEVFVPQMLDKWGRRFGFVKYKGVSNEKEVGLRLEEVWLGNTKLKVNKARFGRENHKVMEE
jgi:hypothetical protein